MWTSDQDDLAGTGGLSEFRVLSSTTRVLRYRLTDTSSDGRTYKGLLDAKGLAKEKVQFLSTDPECKLAGHLPAVGTKITTVLYAQATATGQYAPVIGMVLEWNKATHKIGVKPTTAFPH